MAGRRPTPTHLKLVRGNPGKRAINKREPKSARSIPSPPETLEGIALVHWGRLTVLLDRMGVMTEADGPALEQACQAYADMQRFRQLVKEHGETFHTDSGQVKANPAVAMYADADRRYKGYLVEFGLSPAARSKVKVPDGESEDDKAARYF